MTAAGETLRADVAVVGAGIVGLSLAHELAGLGVDRVAVLERDEAGTGSTARASGGIRRQFEAAYEVELTLAGWPVFERMLADPVFGGGFERTGYAFLAGAEQVEALRAAWRTQRVLGVATEWLGPAEIAGRFPYLDPAGLVGGIFCADDGFLNPWDVTRWLLGRCRDAGVTLHERCPVTGFDLAAGRIRAVEAGALLIEADVVVVAAGAWTGEVCRLAGLDAPVEPSPRVKLVTDHQLRLPADMPLVTDLSTGVYVRSERGAAVVGAKPAGTPVGFTFDTGAAALGDIATRATVRFPSLADARIARLIMGLYEVTPDGRPLAGRLPGTINGFVVAGFNGHGIMHGPPVARAAAELIVRGSPRSLDLGPLDPARFGRPGGGRRNATAML